MMLIPGKILVIENDWDDVKETIESLWGAGEAIVYLSDIPEEEKCPSNVRLVILDLVLDGSGDLQNAHYEMAAQALRRIEQKTGFFLVAVFSVHVTGDNRDEVIGKIRGAYREQTGAKNLPEGVIAAFGKGEIGREKLQQMIERWIKTNPEAGVVFEWEKATEKGRDQTASQLMDVGGIRTVLKALEKECGKASVPGEAFTLFNRLLLRNSLFALDRKKISPLLDNIVSSRQPSSTTVLEWYPKIRYLQAYNCVGAKENFWTGDIFKTGLSDTGKQYAVIVTPACDFAQKEVDQTGVKVVYGIRVDPLPDYADTDGNVHPVVRKLGCTKERKWKKRNDVIGSIIKGSGLPHSCYVLHFIKDSANASDYFHILLDFTNVTSRRIPRSWQRICRVDAPYVDDLIQKYASFSARIGRPDIPGDVVEQEKQRLKP